MASIQDILLSINTLNQTVSKLALTVFPATSVSTSIPSSVGVISFLSSEPTAFLVIQTSSGGLYRVPAYNNF